MLELIRELSAKYQFSESDRAELEEAYQIDRNQLKELIRQIVHEEGFIRQIIDTIGKQCRLRSIRN